jgi:hypothetical protein
MNYEGSYLNDIKFNKENEKMVGGYVYGKPIKEKEILEYTEGGGLKTFEAPIGLIVNKCHNNTSKFKESHIGVISMNRINEFLDLNYKPMKHLSRKVTNIIKNKTKKKR